MADWRRTQVRFHLAAQWLQCSTGQGKHTIWHSTRAVPDRSPLRNTRIGRASMYFHTMVITTCPWFNSEYTPPHFGPGGRLQAEAVVRRREQGRARVFGRNTSQHPARRTPTSRAPAPKTLAQAAHPCDPWPRVSGGCTAGPPAERSRRRGPGFGYAWYGMVPLLPPVPQSFTLRPGGGSWTGRRLSMLRLTESVPSARVRRWVDRYHVSNPEPATCF
jgi:hypothetical protein